MLKRISALVFAVLMLATVFPVHATPETQQDLYVGQPYEYEIWRGYMEGDDVEIVGGYLPSGLELAKIRYPNDGYTRFVVRGTATQTGVFTVRFEIRPAAGMYSDLIVVFLVMKNIQLSSTTMPDGYVGQYYSRQIHSNYSDGEIEFTEYYNPGGPNQLSETGLSLDMDGYLRGTPGKAGTFKFWIYAESTLPGNVSDTFLIQITIKSDQTTPTPTNAPSPTPKPTSTPSPTAAPTAGPTVTEAPSLAKPNCEFIADSIVYYDPNEELSVALIGRMGAGCLPDMTWASGLPDCFVVFIDGAGNQLMLESLGIAEFLASDPAGGVFSFDLPIDQDGKLFTFHYIFKPIAETAPDTYPAGTPFAAGFLGN